MHNKQYYDSNNRKKAASKQNNDPQAADTAPLLFDGNQLNIDSGVGTKQNDKISKLALDIFEIRVNLQINNML